MRIFDESLEHFPDRISLQELLAMIHGARLRYQDDYKENRPIKKLDVVIVEASVITEEVE